MCNHVNVCEAAKVVDRRKGVAGGGGGGEDKAEKWWDLKQIGAMEGCRRLALQELRRWWR